MQGYRLWRRVRADGGGRVAADLERRTIRLLPETPQDG